MSQKVLVVYRERAAAESYARAVELGGAEPVLREAIPSLAIGACRGLLLTGGGDVNPALYGEAAHAETEPPDVDRDSVEGQLIDEALARDVPIFAICRGMQILNVHLGGSLIQHLPTTAQHVRRTPDRSVPAHQVTIEPGTILAGIAQHPTWDVNSRHHQAVARLAAGLQVSAKAQEDGTVEAIEMPSRRFVLAVQWHPEDQAPVDPEQRKLFQSFAAVL